MTSILSKVRSLVADSPPRRLSNLDEVELVQIQSGALREVAGYLETKRWTSVVMVVDGNTYDVAGQPLASLLTKSSIQVQVTSLHPDRKGDVIADEISLIQVILDIQQSGAKAVLAVGGERFTILAGIFAYTAGIPFISIPTAASVDGFNSKGAPIIIRGRKDDSGHWTERDFCGRRYSHVGSSTAYRAGFGDMLGKYTSLFDWKFGSLVADEPYLQISADITRSALNQCVKGMEQIAERTEEGAHLNGCARRIRLSHLAVRSIPSGFRLGASSVPLLGDGVYPAGEKRARCQGRCRLRGNLEAVSPSRGTGA